MQAAQLSAGRCSIGPIVKGSKRGPFLSGRRVAAKRPSQHARPQRRLNPAQPQAVFDYCATQGNMVGCSAVSAAFLRVPELQPEEAALLAPAFLGLAGVESTARSWRAAGLLLMRQTVDQENRQAIVRGAICLIYMIEICLWVVIMVAMPAMVNDPGAAITSAQTGTLLAVGTAGSTVGKGVAAAIMDAIDPRIGMIGVLLTVAAFNSGFALSNSLLMYCFFWGVGRIFHSSGWVAATRLICTWTPEQERGAALGQLSFAARLGFMLGGAGLGGFLLMGYSWRFVFQFVSVAAVLCAAVLIFLIPAAAPHPLTPEDGASHADYCITVPRDNRPKVSAASGDGRVLQADTAWGRSKGVSSQQQAEDSGVLDGVAPDASTATSQKVAVKEFASDAQVWCAILGRCLLHLVFEFQAFLNLYVQQVLKISAGAAAQVAAGYSFGSAIAVFGGGLIYVKLSGSGRRNLVVALCAVQAVGMWLLLQTTSTIPVITLTTLLGTAMSLPYYVPGPAYNLRRGGNFSAVLEGVTEMAAFGCAILFDLAVGKVLPTAGWNGVIKMLLVCAVAGTAVMAVFMQQEKQVVDQQNQMKAAIA